MLINLKTLFIPLALLLSNVLSAQTYTGDLFLTTQAQVDNFFYQEVTGKLEISGSAIWNLDSLVKLRSIGNGLSFINCGSLTKIDGFDSLRIIEGVFGITNCDRVKSVSGFELVDSIKGQLYIHSNDSLQTMSGLGQVKHLPGGIVIVNNPLLLAFTAIPQIEGTIGAFYLHSCSLIKLISTFPGVDSIVGGPLHLLHSSMASLDFFPNLTYCSGDVNIISNDDIQHLDGLGNLEWIDGELIIQNNSSLKNLDSLHVLQNIYYELDISDNDSLISIDGLSGLQQAPSNILLNCSNPGISSFHLFDNINTVESLSIEGFPGLSTLNSLSNLDSCLYRLSLTGLTGLKTTSGMESMKYIRTLLIHNNPVLEKVEGFDSLNMDVAAALGTPYSPTYTGGLSISGNSELKEIGQFPFLTIAYGNLTVYSNPKLLVLDTFSELDSVYGKITIQDNANLLFLKGFDELEFLEEKLFISQNSQLAELGGFHELDSIEGTIQVYDNNSLYAITGFSTFSRINPGPVYNLFRLANLPSLQNICGLHYFVSQINPNLLSTQISTFNLPPSFTIPGAIGIGPCIEGMFPAIGNLYNDGNNDCIKNNSEAGLAGFIVRTDSGNHFSLTDSSGNFELLLDTTGYTLDFVFPYSLQQLAPYTTYCDTTQDISVSQASLPVTVPDWGINLPNCSIFSLTANNVVFRRCFQREITYTYNNLGSLASTSATLEVSLPPFLEIISTSIPFGYSTNGTILFQLGAVQPNQTGTITIMTKVPCTNIEHLGIEQCIEAWIYSTPDLASQLPDWDSAQLSTSIFTQADSTHFNITNIGSSPMSDSSLFTIYVDTLIFQQGKVKLNNSENWSLALPSLYKTYRLEVDQASDYPKQELLSSAIEGGKIPVQSYTSKGMISKFSTPKSRSAFAHTTVCQPIIGAYDPNDKKVSPSGVGPLSYVKPGTRLTYRVRFQNTGTDTAFKVTIIDSLSSFLDPASFEFQGSSSPCTIEMKGDSITFIVATFSPIFLPDSTTDEENSHGFLEFSISPGDAAIVGTSIENYADIYFDFNPPIQTDTTLTEFGIYSYGFAPALSAPPYNLSVVDTALLFPALSWFDSSNVNQGYIIQRSVDSLYFETIDSVLGPTVFYVDNTDSLDTDYWYRILGYNQISNSAPSNIGHIYQNTPLPLPPTSISIDTSMVLMPIISWTKPNYFESSFIIDRSQDLVNFSPIDTIGANSNQYQDSVTSFNQHYWYRIKSLNSVGTSIYSDTVLFIQAPPLPAAPQSFRVSDSVLFSPHLTWVEPNYFEEGYVLEMSLDGITFSLKDSINFATSSYTDSLEIAYQQVYYRLLAYNQTGNSLPSTLDSILQILPIPADPTQLEVLVNDDLTATLSWDDNSSYEYTFVVEEKIGSSPFFPIDSTSTNVSQILVAQQEFDITYQYRVIAKNNTGSSAPTNIVIVTHPFPPAKTPENLTIISAQEELPVLQWKDVSLSEEGFILERSSSTSPFTPLANLPQNTTSFKDSTILSSGVYTYRLFAYNSLGNSDYSNKAVHLFNPVGIIDEHHQNQWQLYPNPVVNLITLKNKGITTDVEVLITDVTGKLVYNEDLRIHDVHQIHCEFLPQGRYFLSILQNGEKISTWEVQKR